MFLVAEVEVKEHRLPRFSWSSNTILCVGVSSSECRLCILHSLEFPTYSMLLTDSFAEKTAFPASSTCSWDLVLPIFVRLFIVHISFDSVEDGSRIPCKDSKQMINTMLFRGSIRNTDGEDFLLLSVFTAPLTSGVRWHQSGCWHELSRHHSMRAEAPSDRLTLAHMQPGWQHSPDFWSKKLKTSKAESFHECFLSPGCLKINASPVHSETLCQNCWCWHMRRELPLAEQPAGHLPCSQRLRAWSCCALKNSIWIIKPWQESIPACGSTCRDFSLLPL